MVLVRLARGSQNSRQERHDHQAQSPRQAAGGLVIPHPSKKTAASGREILFHSGLSTAPHHSKSSALGFQDDQTTFPTTSVISSNWGSIPTKLLDIFRIQAVSSTRRFSRVPTQGLVILPRPYISPCSFLASFHSVCVAEKDITEMKFFDVHRVPGRRIHPEEQSPAFSFTISGNGPVKALGVSQRVSQSRARQTHCHPVHRSLRAESWPAFTYVNSTIIIIDSIKRVANLSSAVEWYNAR